MHDVKQDLRRAAGGFPSPSFDLEAVRRRKGRRELLRRAGTFATVIVLVTASGSALWSAFRGGSGGPGDGGTVALPANGVIWFTQGVIGGRMEGIQLGSVQPDGTHREILTDGIPGTIGRSTSPDGSTILFERDPEQTPDGDYGIWTMRTDGSALTQLTPSDGVDGGPQWSPDGTQILFTRHLGGVPGNPRSGIFVMNADGSDVHALSDDPQIDYASAGWSPDGARILVNTYDAEGEGYVLFVMNADGSGLREIYRGPCGSPQWSPAGDGVLFQTGRTLQLLNIGTGSRRAVVDGLTQDVTFRWSPDGTQLLYAPPVSPAGGNELHVVDVATGSDDTVASGLEWGNPQPTWSPDGTRIAFVRDGDIWTVMAGGTDEQRITNTPQYEGLPVWAAAEDPIPSA
jgi:Tol biopolymer transport system component